MQVKKKHNRGGVIKSWPPDTEVMTSDNTAVSAPQLNFLANQLMPAVVPSNIEAEMLNREGIPAVSSQPGRASQDYVRAGQAINQARKQSEAQIQELVNQGFTREAAVQHFEAYAAGQAQQTPGTATSIAPVMEFLSPAGDVMAMAEAVGQALQGNLGGAALGGGLATASIFMPGTIRSDAMADDMIRLGVRRNVDKGAMPDESIDIIDYIQETATPGDISFGPTRSQATGGGPRSLDPSTLATLNAPRPLAGQSPAEIVFAGRSLGESIASQPGISKESLEATRLYLNTSLATVNEDMVRYYQGIAQGLGQPGLGDLKFEQVSIGGLGDNPIKYNIDRTSPVDKGADLIRMQTLSGSPFNLKMYAIREGGDVGYDFALQASPRHIKNSRAYKSRVRELEKEGLSKEVAEQAAMKETQTSLTQGLNKMYSEVKVGENVFTGDYSADSYPIMLNNLSRGKYMVMEDAFTKGLDNPAITHPLNNEGRNLTLFRKMNLDLDLSQKNLSVLEAVRSNKTYRQRVSKDASMRMKGVAPTAKAVAKANADAEKHVLLRGTREYSYGKEMGLNNDQIESFGQEFVGHINKQINAANENSFDNLVRQRSREDGIDLQDAQSEILEEFIKLPQATFDLGNYNVPVPRILKVRAEEGAYLTAPKFKTKKKRAAYGMRVKK
jgi:hypothetical protein